MRAGADGEDVQALQNRKANLLLLSRLQVQRRSHHGVQKVSL